MWMCPTKTVFIFKVNIIISFNNYATSLIIEVQPNWEEKQSQKELQMISNAMQVKMTKLWGTQNYIFFSPWSKFLLSKLQSLIYFAIANQFYQSLLLEMEKQLRICIQYLQAKFSHEENLDRKKAIIYMVVSYMHACIYIYVHVCFCIEQAMMT